MKTCALASREPNACRSVRRLRSPAWFVVTLVAGLASTLATASALTLMVVIGLASVHAILETPSLRRRRAFRALRIAHRKLRIKYASRLERANVPAHDFEVLADIVDRVAAIDETTTASLETLLERYVEAMLARRCYRAALEYYGDPARLDVQLATSRVCHPFESVVLERRVAQSHEVAERLKHLEDSMAELAELIRYCAERASLPEIWPLLDDDGLAVTLAHYDACAEIEGDPERFDAPPES